MSNTFSRKAKNILRGILPLLPLVTGLVKHHTKEKSPPTSSAGNHRDRTVLRSFKHAADFKRLCCLDEAFRLLWLTSVSC